MILDKSIRKDIRPQMEDFSKFVDILANACEPKNDWLRHFIIQSLDGEELFKPSALEQLKSVEPKNINLFSDYVS